MPMSANLLPKYRMDLFQGNMETIVELLQTHRTSTSANPNASNVTHAGGMTNPTVVVGATVETPAETLVPTTGSRQLVPAYLNRFATAYPWGIPQNFVAHFANGGAFFPHQALAAPTAVKNVVFFWGVPTVQTPLIDVANPEDNQGQVPTETPDIEDEY